MTVKPVHIIHANLFISAYVFKGTVKWFKQIFPRDENKNLIVKPNQKLITIELNIPI